MSGITRITRDWGTSAPNIVRMVADDTLATVFGANYISGQADNLATSNSGEWAWVQGDIVAVSATDGNNFGVFDGDDFATLVSLPIGNGSVTLPVADGNFTVFDGTLGGLQDLGYAPSDAAKTEVAMVDDATVLNHIMVSTDTAGTVGNLTGLAINDGGLQAGRSGVAGVLASFPAIAARGSLKIAGVANTGDTDVTISNAAHGQATVVSIPDGGQATTEFIIADSAGTQSITSGSLSVAAGNLSAGSSGNAGTVSSFPTTAAKGSLKLAAVDNTNDDDVTVSNRAHGQATVYSIGDVGASTGSILVSAVTADPNANLIWFDVTVGQAALATAGTVILVDSSGTKQYKVRELMHNDGGTNFSGGGGDRLGQVGDGTSIYAITPAASLQTVVNARWGSTAIAFPTAIAANTSTAAGADLVYAYNGGATDYTAGSMVVSGMVQRVA